MSRRPTDVPQKERNEYIPSFIAKKPFYVTDESAATDYLDHQRLQRSKDDHSKWYDRGKRTGPAATKYRKGACENCGAMTHKTKECLSRPRKHGAKWTGKDIHADEVVQKVDLGWDAKRDRWNGYDAREYQNVVQEYEDLETLKRQAKGEAKPASKPNGDGAGVGEAKYAEESDMGRNQGTATRNLRLREDTAKYLLNLDPESAKYDPKTRSMVDMGAQMDTAAALVAEENFIRASGDAAEFERAQRYAWETQERGDENRQHLQANPTQGEYSIRKQKEEVQAKKEEHKKALLDKYGGAEYLQPGLLHQTSVTENERFVEYDETGAIKGEPKEAVKSKYPEDILINNHTSVWGSWWSKFQWGYACCHSTTKNSYCTGEDGKKAFAEAENMLLNSLEEAAAKEHKETGDDDEKSEAATTLKKRTLHELQQGVTEEELERYKRSRHVADDPMAAFLGKDELTT